MSYTKGPWVVIDTAPEDTEWNSRFEVWHEGEDEDVLITSHVNGEANAKLIAAAPELLEALEWMYEVAKSEFGMFESSGLGKAVKEEIAKAKGQL